MLSTYNYVAREKGNCIGKYKTIYWKHGEESNHSTVRRGLTLAEAYRKKRKKRERGINTSIGAQNGHKPIRRFQYNSDL